MEDFFSNFFSGVFQGFTDYTGLGADTSGANSIGGEQAFKNFQSVIATAPDRGQSWLTKSYPYQEPHPMDDWVQQSFQNMANEQWRNLAAKQAAVAAAAASPSWAPAVTRPTAPSTTEPQLNAAGNSGPDPDGYTDPSAAKPNGLPEFSTDAEAQYGGFYGEMPTKKPLASEPSKLGGPPPPKSLVDEVKTTYAQQVDQHLLRIRALEIGAGQALPVGGSMLGKSWADVPRNGGSPESRMWGGPRAGGRHAGVDIPGRPGDPVFAVGGGTVLRVGEGQGYGKMVDVQFPDGTVHRFGHLNSITPGLKAGMQINPGETIGGLGYSGNAGREFPHLHLEVFKDVNAYKSAEGKSSRATWNLRMDPVAYYNRGEMSNTASNEGVKVASMVTGDFLDTVKQIESGGNPNKVTGSYKGYYQLSESDFRKYGGTGSIFDPEQNTKAAAAKFSDISERVAKSVGRSLEPTELYLAHQQGVAGVTSHLKNPDELAWKNMKAAASSSDTWAKRAVWGNLTPEAQRQFGSVDKITSRQFMEFWKSRFESVKLARTK